MAATVRIRDGLALWLLWPALAVAGGDPADVLKRYLASDERAQAAMLVDGLDAANRAALPEGPPCWVPPLRPAAGARVTLRGTRVLVEWKPGSGQGSHREGFAVKGEKVVDVRPQLWAAESRLRDGAFQDAHSRARKVLDWDEDSEEGWSILARAAVRLGDAEGAQGALTQLRTRHPDAPSTLFAAYDVALRTSDGKPEEAARACMETVRAAQADDGRCFALHALQLRGKDNQMILRQELEEALGRHPSDHALLGAQGLLVWNMSQTGKTVDRVMQQQARRFLREALECSQALEEPDRGAAYHALASIHLDTGLSCAAEAEKATLLAPTVKEHRQALLACAEASVLLANRMNRKASREYAVDLELEGRAIMAALMREKPMMAGRKLPAYQAYTKGRASLRNTSERLEISLLELSAPQRKSREEDAVAAGFMIQAVYQALYGADAPSVTLVKTQYTGDPRVYVFSMPQNQPPVQALPSERDLAELSRKVSVRSE